MDTVYVLKNQGPYSDLRYSLRGLINVKHDAVHIVGGLPDWTQNVNHILGEDDQKQKHLNTLYKLRSACQSREVSENFILMNDDFFITRPTKITNYHGGLLSKRLETIQKQYGGGQYYEVLHRTAQEFIGPLDYSLHFPMTINKKKFLKLFDIYDMNLAYSFRSLYGNHYKIGGTKRTDKKMRTLADLHMLNETLVSSDDAISDKLQYHIRMLDKFPNGCEYEKDAGVMYRVACVRHMRWQKKSMVQNDRIEMDGATASALVDAGIVAIERRI